MLGFALAPFVLCSSRFLFVSLYFVVFPFVASGTLCVCDAVQNKLEKFCALFKHAKVLIILFFRLHNSFLLS